ncbi:hypothetical protein D9M68_927420 [compost metagenome]
MVRTAVQDIRRLQRVVVHPQMKIGVAERVPISPGKNQRAADNGAQKQLRQTVHGDDRVADGGNHASMNPCLARPATMPP